MGPGQGNNAGAGVGDAPRQAFFCNEKRSHLRTYTAHSELSTHVEDFQSGEHAESHWLPNFTILFLKPNAVGEIASGIFAGTHVSTEYSFLFLPFLASARTSSPHLHISHTFVSLNALYNATWSQTTIMFRQNYWDPKKFLFPPKLSFHNPVCMGKT